MSQSQLRQPLNAPSNNNLSKSQLSPQSNKKDMGIPNQGIDFSLGNNQPPSNINITNNLPIPPNINNTNVNNINPMNANTRGPTAQTQGGKPTNQQNNQQGQQNQNGLMSQRNCKLFVMYLISCLISLAGFIVSLIALIKADEVVTTEKFLEFSTLDVKFNFIYIYNPLSALVFFLTIYLTYLSNSNDGRSINYSQSISLFLSMMAFIFGVVNYVQLGEIATCDLSNSICEFSNILSAYKQMIIPISLIPMILLAGTQYIIYRLKTAPPLPPPPKSSSQTKDLELQKGENKLNPTNLNQPPQMEIKNNQQGLPGQQNNILNAQAAAAAAQKIPGNTFQNSRPSVLQTDPKVPVDPRINQRDSKTGMGMENILQGNTNNVNNMNGQFGNHDQIGYQNPVQKFNNQGPVSGRSGSIVNNFGMPMYQPPKTNQLPLEDKEIVTPREQTFQGLNTQQNQNTQGNLGLSQQMQTPTPNYGQSSTQKLNQNNPLEYTPDIHNMKTTISQFTNTPMKSPTKGISPIDRAINSGFPKNNNENIPDLVSNNDYNPFGNTEKGEIQIGKHPYILGAKDPVLGNMLDQVQVMINNQIKSLIIDLKKQNKY